MNNPKVKVTHVQAIQIQPKSPKPITSCQLSAEQLYRIKESGLRPADPEELADILCKAAGLGEDYDKRVLDPRKLEETIPPDQIFEGIIVVPLVPKPSC